MIAATFNRRSLIAGITAAAFSPIGAAPLVPASPSDKAKRTIIDIVIANRILAAQGVVDAYGHVSRRHPDAPDRFLLSRSRSPELVAAEDIGTYGLDGAPIGEANGHPYVERFIHAAIYRARPDIQAVAHAHAEEVLPYTVSKAALVPVIQNAGVLGLTMPVWDIGRRFGDTNLLVSDIAKGEDLARTLGSHRVVLMRGHGFAAGGRSLIELLRMCVYLKENARVLSEASRLGGVIPLSPGEISKIADIDPNAPELRRAWEYWATKAGCGAMLDQGLFGL